MASPTLPANDGTTGDQILTPSSFTRSRVRLRRGVLVSGTDGRTSGRPPPSTASSASSFNPSVFDDSSSPAESPYTPLSGDDENTKGLSGQSCAADPRKVSKLSFTSGRLGEESSRHSQEAPPPSILPATPRVRSEDEEREDTGFGHDSDTQDIMRKIYNDSPISLALVRNSQNKPVKRDEKVAGISESLGKLDIERKNSEDTDFRQQLPEQIDEVVSSGACQEPQPGEQQELLDVADSSLSEEVEISCPPSSRTSLSSKDTTESSPKAGLDATGSLDADIQGDLADEPHPTPAKTATRRQSSRVTRPSLEAKEARATEEKEEETRAQRGRPPKARARGTRAWGARAQGTRAKIARAKQDVLTPPPPIFSNFHEPQCTEKEIHEKLFNLIKGNDKCKVGPRSPSKAKPRSPSKAKPPSPSKAKPPSPSKDTLRSSLKAKAKSPRYGYLYIYTSSECADHVKIGVTSGTPRERIKQWGACDLPITRVKDDKSVPFFHFELVEKLIQAELCNVRRKYSCYKCGKSHNDNIEVEDDKRTTKITQHGEWYEISEEEGLAIVQKWRSWLVACRPYNANGVLRPRWAAKLGPTSTNIAIMDIEEWVAEWIQPLEVVETMVYFWGHCIKKLEGRWLNIHDFLMLLLLLIGKGIELLPFFGPIIFVSILAYADICWINATCAFFFVILGMLAWLWMTF
ncbi:hypothetical protein V493_05561 [Pseudogymnoascus sp. VKM F-4281 (FW-2241)]|nr:hypothetical protein V493_05561 [Pseudogymnoascus sp. VKM F-4281 (FW-2241)]